jgi:hypothetical protein
VNKKRWVYSWRGPGWMLYSLSPSLSFFLFYFIYIIILRPVLLIFFICCWLSVPVFCPATFSVYVQDIFL